MQKVLCFGELLLRLSPQLQQQWLQHAQMPVYVGGAELNVAVALATWQVPVAYCTALPHHYITEEIIQSLHHKNIDTAPIQYGGNRIGIYFLPQGADLKHAGVIYDRAHSSFASLQPGTIDWDSVLANVGWFHFSAITPALNATAAVVCKEALEAATKKDLTVSVDLNYRAKLWQYGKKPVDVMPELVQYCHVIMANIWSANTLLRIAIDEQIHEQKSKDAYLHHAMQTAAAAVKLYPRCHTVVNTFRFDEGAGIRYYATLFQKAKQYVSGEYYSNAIADKAGSGDCCMAGLIYGLQQQHKPQQIINFAAAAAFGKLHEAGDSTNQSIETIKAIINNYGQTNSIA